MNKIVRSVCMYSKDISRQTIHKLNEISNSLSDFGYYVQTRRIVTPADMQTVSSKVIDKDILLSVGSIELDLLEKNYDLFCQDKRLHCNFDLTENELQDKHVDFLFKLMYENPQKTFNFAFVFNNNKSSPYFPSATYEKDGYSIGLQSTNLYNRSEGISQWLNNMELEWKNLYQRYHEDSMFLGIDSSIAPLGEIGSFIDIALLNYKTFEKSILSDFYTKISSFLTTHNPIPVGLCGLMFPCLEDSALTNCYEKGQFDLKTNLFLSLHSGLGIDTYPIGIDEDKSSVINILKLTKALSIKHNKALSVRFVSDGKAKIGSKTNFNNKFLNDVIVQPLI